MENQGSYIILKKSTGRDYKYTPYNIEGNFQERLNHLAKNFDTLEEAKKTAEALLKQIKTKATLQILGLYKVELELTN